MRVDYALNDLTVDGRLLRSLGPFGFVAVDSSNVNLDDLINMQPGQIVRVRGRPCDVIAVYCAPDAPTLGCVAGWISEDE